MGRNATVVRTDPKLIPLVALPVLRDETGERKSDRLFGPLARRLGMKLERTVVLTLGIFCGARGSPD